MNYREYQEWIEDSTLSHLACKSKTAKRVVEENESKIRTEYQRDRDRILHSKAFRRLKHKTQVYISPEKDHYRTRLTHTLEVSQIGRTIVRALRLNEDLVEAASLGHDLGHTPFGHMGEDALNEIHPNGFKHYKQSIRVVKFLEINEKRQGLNLTLDTLDAIENHTGGNKANTLEGKIIKFADRIAYINHDIDDSIRAGIITEDDLPKELTDILGHNHSDRIDTMVMDVVDNSFGKDEITMSESVYDATMRLRKFMFDNVYYNQVVKEDQHKVHMIIENLYSYYKKNFEKIPESNRDLYKLKGLEDSTIDDIVTDYIAGMTDTFARDTYRDIFIPRSWN